MGMRTDCLYGMGIEIAATGKQMANFIKKHRDTISKLKRGKELLRFVDDGNIDILIDDWDDYENLVGTDEGIYGVIVDVIFTETKIPVEYHHGQGDDKDVIIYCAAFPWNFNEFEKTLKAEDIENAFNRYIPDIDENIKYDEDIMREYCT